MCLPLLQWHFHAIGHYFNCMARFCPSVWSVQAIHIRRIRTHEQTETKCRIVPEQLTKFININFMVKLTEFVVLLLTFLMRGLQPTSSANSSMYGMNCTWIVCLGESKYCRRISRRLRAISARIVGSIGSWQRPEKTRAAHRACISEIGPTLPIG